jgi:sugar/nucleoside kinase (ribokinase family)
MSGQVGDNPPDYLIIGHITKDQHEGGYRLGGTAVYSGVLAHRMGLKVAVYTSGASDLALDIMDGIEIIDQPGSGTTTFINEYTPSGRIQRLLDRAEELDCSQIPDRWKQAKVIHLAPVAREVSITAGEEFLQGFLGYSLQGWMRVWDEQGHVSPNPFPEIKTPVRENAVGILSIEDLGDDRNGLEELLDQFPNLALTLGSEGVELYSDGRIQLIPAPTTSEIDPTGAGDIFAAAFLISWKIRGWPIEQSARLANTLAAASVRQAGIDGIPEKWEIIETIKGQE